VPADFAHRAALEDDDRIGAPHRREAVRDDERGAVLHQAQQGVLDEVLDSASSDEVASSRHEDRRILQQRAGDRQPLPLAARQALAALADPRLVAVGQRRDELVRVRGAGRRLDPLARGARRPVADVAGDGVVEQHRVLRDHADLRPQRGDRHVADVDAVDEDGAAGDVVEARDQVDQRVLPAPLRARRWRPSARPARRS
jgi:hypothetical protein